MLANGRAAAGWMLDAGLADHFQIIPGIYNTRSIYKYEDGPHNQFAGTLNTSTCAVELSNFEIDIFLKNNLTSILDTTY